MLFTFLQALRLRDQDGRFSLPLLVADTGIATWLLITFIRFQDLPDPTPMLLGAGATLLGGLAWLYGLHRDWLGNWFRFTTRALLFAAATTVVLHAFVRFNGGWAFQPRLVWLAAVLLTGLLLARTIYWKLRPPRHWAPLETTRWLLLGVVATWVLWPIYNTKPNGAGDAYWYVMMLSDYLEQLRQGIFPVWIGQSEYAFNGAFSPLRLAPGFQHAGGLLDTLTWHTLDYLAVKNAMLAINTLAAAFFAYFSLRAIIPQRPNTACMLALIYTISPGLLTPLAYGDQYMTFFAAPYLPVVFYGCWRVFTQNDLRAHVLLGAGIGALWFFHTPVALWTSLLAGCIYGVKIVVNWRSGRELKMVGLALLVYASLGIYPVISALSLDNVIVMPIVGLQILTEVEAVFPGIFKPLIAAGNPANYQPGYTALAAGLLGLGLAITRRNPAAWAFAATSLIVLCLMVPIPGLSHSIWAHMPLFIVKVTNTWIYQRLALILVALLIFTLATSLSVFVPKPSRHWTRFGIVIIALASLAWSSREASLLRTYLFKNIPTSSGWEVAYAKHNLVLSRYPYSSFESTPPYFSHAFMDPYLESRLLDRSTQNVVLSNAKSAASHGPGRTLVAEGTFRAVNDNNTTFYLLHPAPTIDPNRHYALRIDFLTPNENGYLQIRGERLFREYIMPDSGVGMNTSGRPPRAFGSTATSSPIVPLYTDAKGPVLLRLTYILPDRPVTPEFDAAHYQLWSYEPGQLPIKVNTLLPYRANIESLKPAYLESPRMWLSGYRARLNNISVPVLRSTNNLCMIEVDAGQSEVEIKYKPPLRVEISYWIAIWGWAAVAAAGFWLLCRRPAPQGLSPS